MSPILIRLAAWANRTYGYVPCWVCGLPVASAQMSIEHIVPRALGGDDRWTNLAISHGHCNNQRGPQAIIDAAGAKYWQASTCRIRA